MTKDQPHHPQNFLNAETIVDYLLQNRMIQFQATGDKMDRESAIRHFTECKALILVKRLLLDEGERVLNSK